MNKWTCRRHVPFFIVLAIIFLFGPECHAAAQFPLPICDYDAMEAGKNLSLLDTLKFRVNTEPFNLVATILFLIAIVHVFFAKHFSAMSEELKKKGAAYGSSKYYFLASISHFLGEVEVIFGIWVLPLIILVACKFGWSSVVNYFNNKIGFAEPIFVFVIMTVSASKPIIHFAESVLSVVAKVGGNTVGAWWVTILIISPLLGSFITEPAAMTIGATLLAKQFYSLNPSKKLRYATIGLLFVNVSIGGTLTHFAAPPILMVAHKWGLTFMKVFSMIGQRAIVAILINVAAYYMLFRREFRSIQVENQEHSSNDQEHENVPAAVIAVHLFFLVWTVVNLHTPSLVIAGFLFFLAFVKSTKFCQSDIDLRSPVLVGFFLASLIVHGGFQEWWIAPVLGSLTSAQLFSGAAILTAFNDNAAITYLSSLVPDFTTNVALQKAVIAGAVTGGGLTVIANAPNPAGQNILAKYFGGNVSPLYLLLSALIPTIITAICFNL